MNDPEIIDSGDTSEDALLKFWAEYLEIDTALASLFAKKGIEELQLAAKEGDVNAYAGLASCYYWGIGVEKNMPLAMELRLKAAEQGDARSQFLIGLAHVLGVGLTKDLYRGLHWLKQAADQGYDEGQLGMGHCYLEGIGVKKNAAQAIKWFRGLAMRDVPMAQFELGKCYLEGRGVKPDSETGVAWLKEAADQECAPACRELAKRNWFAYLLNQDTKRGNEAVEWVQHGVELGDSICQAALADFYLSGYLGPDNEQEGIELLREGAEQANPIAQFWLAYYLRGFCSKYAEREDEAIHWLHEAAEKGYSIAQYMLGRAYMQGEGVEKNEKLANEWRKKAFQQSDHFETLDELFAATERDKANTFILENFPLATFNPIEFDLMRDVRSQRVFDEKD